MEHLIPWVAFVGAWLLFSGPVFQAALELREEDFERDRLHEVAEGVPRPDPISPWLLLMPPVWWYLRHRRNEKYQRRVAAELSVPEFGQLMHYMNKAAGWIFVGAGAWLIGVAETWALVHEQDWPIAVFWTLVPVMTLAALWNTAVRIRRGNDVLAKHAQASKDSSAAPRGESR